MEITKLKLINFRNYDKLELTFSSKLNIFLGNNAQGKTNLLESIYLLALTRSHRTFRDKELIKQGATKAEISAEVKRAEGNIALEVELLSKGKKTKVNYLEQAKLSNYLGNLNVVLFAPEDLELVKGTPSIRRKFIDMELGQIRPVYLTELKDYQKVLKQRNNLLKQNKVDELMLDIIDEQLARHGSYIIIERQKFIKELEKIASKLHENISSNKEKLTLKYETITDTTEQEVVEEEFRQILQKNRAKDLEQKITLKGPHRDDLKLFINNLNVQLYGSQGQQRLAALSLKLSEVELIKNEIGEYPILLLDDVMSELDNDRQMQLMKIIENKVQTFITTTTLAHLQNNMEVTPVIYEIQAGKVERK